MRHVSSDIQLNQSKLRANPEVNPEAEVSEYRSEPEVNTLKGGPGGG